MTEQIDPDPLATVDFSMWCSKRIYIRCVVDFAVPVGVWEELLTDKATNCSSRDGALKQKSHFTPSQVLSVVSGRVAGQIFPDPVEAVWAK